jgi:pSer/pThr/pTyr-binding forkhead associated (FHA) protein
MDSITTYQCFYCNAVNEIGNSFCNSCKEQTTIAVLKSLGEGSVPKDYVWPLFPHDISIGSSTSNDIAIPSNRLDKKHCRIVFQKDSFYLERLSRDALLVLNGHNVQFGVKQKLVEGAIIRLGLDELKICYHNLSQGEMNLRTEADRVQRKLDKQHCVNQASSRLMLVLGYLQELHSSTDIKELLSNSVDAVLKLTDLNRGYAFITELQEDQMSLKEVVSRKLGGLDFMDKEYKISKSMLTKVLQGDGTVIIEDVDQAAAGLTSNSMRDFKIKALVCLPLNKIDPVTKEKQLLGIIYADKMMATNSMPPQIQSTLQMLSQLIVSNIDRCMKFQESIETCNQYNEYFQNVASEIETIQGNLAIIAENMNRSKGTENFKNLADYISGEQQKLESIIYSIREAAAD